MSLSASRCVGDYGDYYSRIARKRRWMNVEAFLNHTEYTDIEEKESTSLLNL